MGKRQSPPEPVRYAGAYTFTRELVPVDSSVDAVGRRYTHTPASVVAPPWFGDDVAGAAVSGFSTTQSESYSAVRGQNAAECAEDEAAPQHTRRIMGEAEVLYDSGDTFDGGPQEAEFLPLDILRKDDMQELRTLPYPPASVKKTLKVVSLLLGEPAATSWKEHRLMIGDSNFLARLAAVDYTAFDTALLDRLRSGFIDQPACRPSALANVSAAAVGLCQWCHNIYLNAKLSIDRRTNLAVQMSKARGWPLCHEQNSAARPTRQNAQQPRPPLAPWAVDATATELHAVTTSEKLFPWPDDNVYSVPGRHQRLGVWSDEQQRVKSLQVHRQVELATPQTTAAGSYQPPPHKLTMPAGRPATVSGGSHLVPPASFAGYGHPSDSADMLKMDEAFRGRTENQDGFRPPASVAPLWIVGRPAIGVQIRDGQFHTMIPAGAPCGTTARQSFSLGHDQQQELAVLVLEEGETSQIGKLLVGITCPVPPGFQADNQPAPLVEVCLSLEHSTGRLSVVVRELYGEEVVHEWSE